MIFLLLGIIEVITTVIMSFFALFNPILFLAVIPMIISCIFSFKLFNMHNSLITCKEDIERLTKSLRECKEQEIPLLKERIQDLQETTNILIETLDIN